MFFFFTNKYNNKLKKKNELYYNTRRRGVDKLIIDKDFQYFNFQGNLNLIDWSTTPQNFKNLKLDNKKNSLILKMNNYLQREGLVFVKNGVDCYVSAFKKIHNLFLNRERLRTFRTHKFIVQKYLFSKINNQLKNLRKSILKKKINFFFKLKINKKNIICLLN